MMENLDINTLLIILCVLVIVILVFYILGRIFEPIRKIQSGLKNGVRKINKSINRKREQKRLEIEQKRKEEYERLKIKQKENELFILNTKEKLDDLQRTFKEFEEFEKITSVLYEEIEEKTTQIELLKEKSSKFIFKIFDNWKINKLNRQCAKYKQKIEEAEVIITEKKSAIKYSIGELLNTFN